MNGVVWVTVSLASAVPSGVPMGLQESVLSLLWVCVCTCGRSFLGNVLGIGQKKMVISWPGVPAICQDFVPGSPALSLAFCTSLMCPWSPCSLGHSSF
eukprot:458236-Amphidinium_carterae.1